MRVSLVSSLHLDHGATGLNRHPGEQPVMQSFIPVGLLSLKAAADRDLPDVEVRVTEVNALVNSGAIRSGDTFYEDLANVVAHSGDDFVGLMTDADSLHHTVALAEHVRRLVPTAMIALGGPASSPISYEILSNFHFVDLVVTGEGEITFVELLDALRHGHAPADIRGVTWRKNGTVYRNPHRVPIRDLDTLPIPAFDAVDMNQGALYLDVGRGCPFACQFCATAPFWDRKFRVSRVTGCPAPAVATDVACGNFPARHFMFS